MTWEELTEGLPPAPQISVSQPGPKIVKRQVSNKPCRLTVKVARCEGEIQVLDVKGTRDTALASDVAAIVSTMAEWDDFGPFIPAYVALPARVQALALSAKLQKGP